MPRPGGEYGFNPAAAELEQPRPTSEQIKWLRDLPVVSFRRAKGSGGQSVNTTASAARLRWNIEKSDPDFRIFSKEERKNLIAFFSAKKGRWGKEVDKLGNETGVAIFVRVNERSFEQNKRSVLDQLVEEVKTALTVAEERIEEVPEKAKKKRKAAGMAAAQAKRKQERHADSE